MDGLKTASIEALMNAHEDDTLCKARLEKAREKLKELGAYFDKRWKEIEKNDAKYSEEGLADQKDGLKAAIATRVQEVVDSLSFKADIEAARKEMVIPKPSSEIGELMQLLKLQEIRRAMWDSGDRFQELFIGHVMAGDPDVIQAIETTPVPFPVDAEVLKQGKERRLKVLNPSATHRLEALQAGQASLEAMGASFSPVKNVEDFVKKYAEGETNSRGAGTE